jgi:hypothetical protein
MEETTDTAPFDVVEPFEIGDVSDQTGQELMDAVRGIAFEVKKSEIRVVEDKIDGTIKMRRLNLQCKIGPLGVDGNGKYAGKVLFADLLAWYNPLVYTKDWWKKSSRFPIKSFMQAIGHDPKAIPAITDEFLNGLVGKLFKADITVKSIQKKNEIGEYVDTGDKVNELANFKKLEETAL